VRILKFGVLTVLKFSFKHYIETGIIGFSVFVSPLYLISLVN